MLSNNIKYKDLRSFLKVLEHHKDLKKITSSVNPELEMTEIADRTLKLGGPALLFENPKGYSIPVLCNLFGTPHRIALSMGKKNISSLREIGELLSFLKEPDVPTGMRDFLSKIPHFRHILHMPTKKLNTAPCQEIVWTDKNVDITKIPVMRCWPNDISPLITWGITITRSPKNKRQNLGIYRQQILSKNTIIIRWLPHRGGALDFKEWYHQKTVKKKFPIAIALGSDPATLLSAVVPIPNTLSEYALSGLLRGCKTEVVKCISCDLNVPAHAEIILEGFLEQENTKKEGPFGDHTGYYNTVEKFPVCTITHITHRNNPLYHSTYTGRPPDEPSILGAAMNEIFIPIIQKQFPEIADFYLPPEGCSYRLAVVTIKKQYLGHAKRIIFGIWSFLYQFIYTKFIIVCDNDINARNWKDIIWAITTRMDPSRDIIIIKNTPIDYLDFSSPISGLGSKMGIDATNKWPGETNREWGIPIEMDKITKNHINNIWDQLNIMNHKK